MANLHTPDQFKSKQALMLMGLIGLGLAYLLLTRAFDTGSIWQYLGTFLLFILSVRLIFRSIKSKQ